MEKKRFQKTIWDHYTKHRRSFPWRETRDPYKILISEVMLQQTQADRVVSKYLAFLKRFPDFKTLARVKPASVLKEWQGLGYNRRALALKRLAEVVVKEYRGCLPQNREQLTALPGIGPYTASAVLAFAFNTPTVFIETNIRTVYIHFFFEGKKKIHDKELLPFIEKTLDTKNPREWYYALMDYGAHLKKQGNPSRRSTHYVKQSKFKGSERELRGKILKLLLEYKKIPMRDIAEVLQEDPERVTRNVESLHEEGFLHTVSGIVKLR